MVFRSVCGQFRNICDGHVNAIQAVGVIKPNNRLLLLRSNIILQASN
jgi:hypothetical protein